MVTVSELIEMLANIDGNKEVKIIFSCLDEENNVFNGKVDYTDEDREEVTIYCYKEEDKKPFDLVEFLRENLEPKDFEYGKYNYYISYENDIKEFEYKYDYYNEDIGTVYLKEINNGKMIASLLDFNKVTPQQLKQAYKELGWL